MVASATMTVAYEHDDQAQEEAARHPLSKDEADRLSDKCARKAAKPGPGGVHARTVSFPAEAWDDLAGLPASIRRAGSIARGDLLDMANRRANPNLGTHRL